MPKVRHPHRPGHNTTLFTREFYERLFFSTVSFVGKPSRGHAGPDWEGHSSVLRWLEHTAEDLGGPVGGGADKWVTQWLQELDSQVEKG